MIYEERLFVRLPNPFKPHRRGDSELIHRELLIMAKILCLSLRPRASVVYIIFCFQLEIPTFAERKIIRNH